MALHEPFYVEGGRRQPVEVALQYTDGYTESVFAFANNINTVDGGTHLTGFRSALTRSLNDYGANAGPAQGWRDNFTGEDVREGLTAIISVKMPDPQFESQTKAKLGNAEGQDAGEPAGGRGVAEWLEKNHATARRSSRKARPPAARAGRAPGARPGDPQERAGEHDPARQAGRLLGA